MRYNKLIKEINIYAKKHLTKSRYEHSVRVAEYAKYLAELHKSEGVKPKKAYFSGLSHDMCKQCSDDELVDLVKQDGQGIDTIEKTRLNLLHGRAAAVILKQKFQVEDRSILNAIAYHTFGYMNIDALGKIIYIADKIEPERPNTQQFRNFAKKASLNELMLKILVWNIDYIKTKGASVHPLTKKMYKQIREELSEN